MSPKLQELITQAEKRAWDRMNSYQTVLEAIKTSRSRIIQESMAEVILQECIQICVSNGHNESADQIKALLNKD